MGRARLPPQAETIPDRLLRPTPKELAKWLYRTPTLKPGRILSRGLTDRLPVLLFPIRIETRFVDNELLVRIYPDQLAVETHEAELTRPEVLGGRAFRDRFDAAKDDAARRDGWRSLAAQFGPARAAWIARQIDAYDEYGDDLSELAEDAWTVAPTVRTLPDRFLVTVYREDDEVVYEKLGAPIPRELPLFRGPGEAGSGEDLFDEGAGWVADFDEAVRVGMAVTMPIPPDGEQPPFTRLIVIGLRESLAPNRASQLVEDWIDGQHYTTGFEFLAYGTPTNNTEQSESGYSETTESADDAYSSEILGTGGAALDPARSNGGRLRLALGLPEESRAFSHVRLASGSADTYAHEAQSVLWSVTGGYFLDTMLGDVVPAGDRPRVAEHFARFVRGSGPFSALRIGNLPYGVLPVTRVAPATEQDPEGWTASTLDSATLEGDVEEWAQFDQGLHGVLHALFERWLELATRAEQPGEPAPVPRIGASQDPDRELLQALAMEPRSTSYRLRPFVDERLTAVLLLFLRYRYGPSGQPNAWVRSWVEEWQAQREPTVVLLTGLGADRADVEAARVLRILGWGSGSDLTGPLVGAWIPYLRLLCEQGHAAPAAAYPELLYEMLWRALRLAPNAAYLRSVICDLAGAEVLEFFNRAATPEEIVQRIIDDPQFGKGPPRAYGVRSKLAQRLLSTRNALPGGRFEKLDQIDRVFRVGPDTLHDIIYSFPGPKPVDLDGLFRDALDLCTHRLDAWITSLATKRLEAMRASRPTGVHIGAYGWVEDLDRAEDPSEGGGYVHAPSLGQAGAAALARNAYLTHDVEGGENPFRIDLTSERVELALRLLEGVRQGQPLGALLGYQFERALHEAALDRYVDNFRSRYPLVAEKEVPATGEEEAPVGGVSSTEAVAARNVVDGMALAEAHRKAELDIDAIVNEQDAALDLSAQANARDSLNREADRLREALDAVGDLLLTEGVFQSVQGNFDRAGAALEAAAGNARPPEIDAVRTPVGGAGLRHRVCLLIPGIGAEDAPEDAGPRTEAEPSFAGWVASLFGDLSGILFGKEGAASLDQTGLEPIDLLYMSALPAVGEETELERRLRYHLREAQGLEDDADVEMDLDRPGGVNELLEVARHVLGVATDGSTLRPSALVRPEEAEGVAFDQATVDDLNARVGHARARLRDRVVEVLDTSHDREDKVILGALLEASRFGIPGAVPSSPGDPELAVRRERIHAEAKVRMDQSKRLRDDAVEKSAYTPDQQVERLQEAMKALFGDSFVVLPVFAAPNADVVDDALTQNGRLGSGAEDRIVLWLQQVAETHKAVRRLEDALMVSEAWNPGADGASPMGLEVAQLPYCEARPWQALSDTEIDDLAGDATGATGECAEPSDGRPRAVLSLVAVSPRAWDRDLAQVTGLLVDEWTETIPSDEVTSGISFQYDAPSSQAPHALLLAVPGRFARGGRWSEEKVREIVKDTLDLAKVRLVDPDALRGVGGVLPALFMPVDAVHTGWDREHEMPPLEESANALPVDG